MGSLPHFSHKLLCRVSLALTLASFAIFPLVQISPRPVGASNPTFSATIANYAFHPQHLNVTTGTQVTWTNNDATQHSVTSTQANLTQGGGHLIDSGSLNSGQSFSYTFYKHGFYPYECSFHSYMTGWVNVTGPDVQPPSSPTGASAIDYTPYIIGGVIAGVGVILSLALLFRRRTQEAKST
jgi:plastocyanin